jgi:hypothetical protein
MRSEFRTIVRVSAVAVVMAASACGGGSEGDVSSTDSPDSVTSATNAVAQPAVGASTQPSTSVTLSGSVATVGNAGKGDLPDACTLLSGASVAAAIGKSASVSQPQKPNESSSRCEWALGELHSLSLTVRAGPNAENTFNNTVKVTGFTHVPMTGADGWINLGARESQKDNPRDYRLVSFGAYDGTYYVYFTLQEPDRDDGASTQLALSLATEVYNALG